MSFTDMAAGPSTKSDGPASGANGWPRIGLGTIVIAIVAIALGLRLWELGDRAFHHDESLDAWWSWRFRNGTYDRYDPVYHGPLRFYITAGFYELFGESEATARLFAALSGTAAVGLPWFLRRELGRMGTIAASVALCVSPTMLYYSRFGREDAQMVFLTLLSLVLGISFLRRPRTATAAGLAFTLAASFAIKESTYMFALMLVVYLIVALSAQFDAQHRRDIGRPLGGRGEFDRSFFATGLLAASAGLVLAVVVGAAADELFTMLALYIAVLSLLGLAIAMPRLRAANINWSIARAGRMLAGVGAVGAVVQAYRVDPGTFSINPVAIAVAIVLMLLAVAITVMPALSSIRESRTWSIALLIGAGALFGHEALERVAMGAGAVTDIAGAETATSVWQISIPALAIACTITLGAFVVVIGQLDGIELPEQLSTDLARTVAGTTLIGGLLLLANEYTESEANRLAAAAALFLFVGGFHVLVRSLPRTTNPEFVWPASLRAIGRIGWIGWLIALGVFVITWWLCFTIFGRVKNDWASGFTRAISYWDSQQEVNRGGQPWYYYFYALPAYEWFFVILASIGSWRALRRPTFMSGIFVWFAIASLVLYSYAGERMPWLIAHPLLPILILAGFGTQQLWQHRDHRLMPAIATACMLGLLLTSATSWRASFPNGADSREILSQAGQATPHLVSALERLDNIDRLSRQSTGEPAVLAISSTDTAWPYSWYLRERPNVLWFDNANGVPDDPTIDVIIADFGQIDLAEYPEFEATLFAMRSWWVPVYNDAGPLGWLSWVRNRELWEQNPNPNFVGVGETPAVDEEIGLVEKLTRIRDSANSVSEGFVSFTGADDNMVIDLDSDAFIEPDDGRDGCGSVDQWFMVRRELAEVERQVYPAPIASMGPLDCASDLLATS